MAAGRLYDPQLHYVVELRPGAATSARGEQTADVTVIHGVVPDLMPWVGGLVDWLGQSRELLHDVLEGGGPGKPCIYKGPWTGGP